MWCFRVAAIAISSFDYLVLGDASERFGKLETAQQNTESRTGQVESRMDNVENRMEDFQGLDN